MADPRLTDPAAAGRSRLAGLGLLAGVLLGACAAPPPSPEAPAGPPAARELPSDPRPLPRYHSVRLGLSLPLPDGPAWRIDDHTWPVLVATHEPTHSTVSVGVFRVSELVGRSQCEALARERKLVPQGDLHTLEDHVAITLGDYDTRVWVAVEPGATPASPLTGHVLAFGGYLRKCYVFAFSTQVPAAVDEPVLSSRLAVARARILGGLTLDTLGVLPREAR